MEVAKFYVLAPKDDTPIKIELNEDQKIDDILGFKPSVAMTVDPLNNTALFYDESKSGEFNMTYLFNMFYGKIAFTSIGEYDSDLDRYKATVLNEEDEKKLIKNITELKKDKLNNSVKEALKRLDNDKDKLEGLFLSKIDELGRSLGMKDDDSITILDVIDLMKNNTDELRILMNEK